MCYFLLTLLVIAPLSAAASDKDKDDKDKGKSPEPVVVKNTTAEPVICPFRIHPRASADPR